MGVTKKLIACAAGAAGAVMAAAGGAYYTAFYAPRGPVEDHYRLPTGARDDREKNRMLSLIREMDAIPYERVFITAHDGVRLSARYYHVKDGAPLQIQFHGYRGTGVRDFSGGNKLAREMGFNTLLVDQRAHGRSGGHTITFGVRERYDCLSWTDYAVERFGPNVTIFLAGVSMGAATVLMASELPLPGNVAGIIADCPYTSPEAIIEKVCRDKKIPPSLGMPLLRLGARACGRFDLRAASALEAVRHTEIPILLIHGEADSFVPCDMSRELHDACAGPAWLLTVPGAGHGLSYIVNTGAYARAVESFTGMCLERKRREKNG